MQSAARKYQRDAARCLRKADLKIKAFLIETAQAWQRLADQVKVGAALPNNFEIRAGERLEEAKIIGLRWFRKYSAVWRSLC